MVVSTAISIIGIIVSIGFLILAAGVIRCALDSGQRADYLDLDDEARAEKRRLKHLELDASPRNPPPHTRGLRCHGHPRAVLPVGRCRESLSDCSGDGSSAMNLPSDLFSHHWFQTAALTILLVRHGVPPLLRVIAIAREAVALRRLRRITEQRRQGAVKRQAADACNAVAGETNRRLRLINSEVDHVA